MKKRGKILVTDDNAGIRSALKLLLSPRFEAVELLPSPAQLKTTVQSFGPDVVLLDMNFSASINTGNEGLFWLRELKDWNPELKVVLFTAYADVSLAVEGMKLGAYDFIVKPWDNEKLLATLERAVQENIAKQTGGRRQNEAAAQRMHWGSSPSMLELKKLLQKIAPTDASVLITGENGTGKDLLASEIHILSERSSGPLVSVDAGAIPETLFESELFGHLKGSFTDAVADRKGKFEQAQGGTLFLDEIGNIPLPMQAKLLRAIQSREIIPLGGSKAIPIDIRLICATNRNLGEMVAQGSFREDLYYRINTVHLQLPALRERPEDIEPLAEIFIKEFSAKYHREAKGLSPDGAQALKEGHWDGNVRELKNCIEKAVILSEHSLIRREDLQVQQSCSRENSQIDTLEQAEEKAVRAAVEKYAGNLSLVAKALNISRPTLYSKLKKYGL